MQVVSIKKVVHGGYGLGFDDGKTIFVPYTVPGDVIEYRITRKKKNIYFATVVKLLEASPMRVEPPCPIFGRCGGCHLQHISYDDELEIKKRIVLESLERIGKIKTELTGLIPSPERYGYRNQAIFRAEEHGTIGFYKRESREIIPFPEGGCLLLPESMRKTIADLPGDVFPEVGDVRARMDAEKRVHFYGLRGLNGPEEIIMKAEGFIYPIKPTSFFQVNRFLLERMTALVRSIPLKVRLRLLDLYCGVGFFSFPLSRVVVEGVGVERDREAYESALRGLRENRIINITFKNRSVEDEIGRLKDFDLVVVDPPRTGMVQGVLNGIIRVRPKELIFISCDPPTLARDAKLLVESGYTLSEVHLIDLFPATYHTETVAVFRRGYS